MHKSLERRTWRKCPSAVKASSDVHVKTQEKKSDVTYRSVNATIDVQSYQALKDKKELSIRRITKVGKISNKGKKLW